MPAPRKYDQETRDRAVRMYQDRRRDFLAESALAARRRVGELLDIKPETLRGWVERAEVDAGQRPGVPSWVEARIKELERDNAELRRANETSSPLYAVTPKLSHPPAILPRTPSLHDNRGHHAQRLQQQRDILGLGATWTSSTKVRQVSHRGGFECARAGDFVHLQGFSP